VIDRPESGGSATTPAWPWAVVSLAAIVPYLSTVRDYFVRDDFGVVQLLAQKPFSYFPRWFVTSWMDHIWGYYPDEIRPFPALSYQLTALGGPVSPDLHHLLNILIHAANGLLVMALAERAARLKRPAAMFAGVIFVLLPVHAESVAWITGRVDSMPAFFYLASFLAYVSYRAGRSSRAYLWSLLLFFVALFTKQNTITMVATLAGYDVIVERRPIAPLLRFVRPYVPYAVMTAGYLWLRYLLFGQVARESTLDARGLHDFSVIHGLQFRHVIGGDMHAPPLVVSAVLIAVAMGVWLAIRPAPPEPPTPSYGGRLLYFGPLWWAIGVLPIAVAGYHSPRHVYLAAVGWAIVLGIVVEAGWRRRATRLWRRTVLASAVLAAAFYIVPLSRAVHDYRTMAFVSHKVAIDVRTESRSLPQGSLVIVGAPGRSWEWALPFAVRRPFQPVNLDAHVHVISPRALSCCTTPWFEETKHAIRAWAAGPASDTAVALRWDRETGVLSRATGVDTPQLPVLVRSLLDMSQPDELDMYLRRMLEELVGQSRF
jgi:hypothetical protein